MKLSNPYEHAWYKKLIFVPIVLVVLSAISLLFLFPLKAGLELKGGLLIQVQTDELNPNVAAISDRLKPFSEDVNVRVYDSPLGGKGIEVELAPSKSLAEAEEALMGTGGSTQSLHELNDLYNGVLLELSQAQAANDVAKAASLQTQLDAVSFKVIEQAKVVVAKSGSQVSVPSDPSAAVVVAERAFEDGREGYVTRILAELKTIVPVKASSWNEVGSSLSKFFLSKARDAVIFAMILSSIVVFVTFRSLVPSFAVIFGVLADLVITAAAMGILGIPLTLASIAALLMLIGFSLQTDVMLTSKVLKRTEGTAAERAFDAFKTGGMMNLAAIVSFGVLVVAASVLNVATYYQIGMIAVIGGLADFFATWFFNAVIVLNYASKKEKGHKGFW